jgi:ferric-dicitrate binding protein FerR (iron transport regulator)
MGATEEAASWFARVRRGVMTLKERQDYDRWIASHANRSALAEMERVWAALEGAARPADPHLGRKAMVAALCASIMLALLSVASNSAFWTSLDWANR